MNRATIEIIPKRSAVLNPWKAISVHSISYLRSETTCGESRWWTTRPG